MLAAIVPFAALGAFQAIPDLSEKTFAYGPIAGSLYKGQLFGVPIYTSPFALETNVTLCAHNPLGAKGCGEAGTIGAPPAIMNALLDALTPLGITDLDMPATPERLFRAMARHRPAER